MADLSAVALLPGFLDRTARTPFVWGEDDCSLFLANWLVALGRPDPALGLRGRYRTALGCARVLRREGGVRAVIARCARVAGLAPTRDPSPGDPGVIRIDIEGCGVEVGALRLGRRWAVRAGSGLFVSEAVPLAAWSL